MFTELRVAGAALVIVAICGMASWCAAHEAATGIVGERMKAMTRLADEMKAMARLVRKREVDAPEIARRARLIRDLSREMPAMFPPGTDKNPHTEAKLAIWQNRSEFERLAQQSERQADELVQAAEQREPTKMSENFTALNRSCGACHELFRAKRHH